MVWQLAGALATFFDFQGHWVDMAATQRAALAAARPASRPARRRPTLTATWAWPPAAWREFGEAQTHVRAGPRTCSSMLGDRLGHAHTCPQPRLAVPPPTPGPSRPSRTPSASLGTCNGCHARTRTGRRRAQRRLVSGPARRPPRRTHPTAETRLRCTKTWATSTAKPTPGTASATSTSTSTSIATPSTAISAPLGIYRQIGHRYGEAETLHHLAICTTPTATTTTPGPPGTGPGHPQEIDHPDAAAIRAARDRCPYSLTPAALESMGHPGSVGGVHRPGRLC